MIRKLKQTQTACRSRKVAVLHVSEEGRICTIYLCCLFCDVVATGHNAAGSNWMAVNNELYRLTQQEVIAKLRQDPGIFISRLRKPTECMQDSLSWTADTAKLFLRQKFIFRWPCISVHFSLITNLTHFFQCMYLFISLLYMFRVTQCSSSGESNCINTSTGMYHSV